MANERDEYKAQASEERNHGMITGRLDDGYHCSPKLLANELYHQVDSLAQERDEYKREALVALEEAGKGNFCACSCGVILVV